MDNSIYVSLSRQVGLFKQMDVVANNVANASTHGFRGDQLLFDQHVKEAGDITFPNDRATYTNPEQGGLEVTHRDFDVAIEGSGYFQVETPLGVRYTRSGSFQLNEAGEIVTHDGHRVLSDQGQPIVLDPEDGEVIIEDNGLVRVLRRDGALTTQEIRGSIGVMAFDNEQLLDKVGNTLYKSDIAPRAALLEEYDVVQGALEKSNVQPVKELTEMIGISRSVTDAARFMDDVHELQRRAISTLSNSQGQ